MAEVKRLAVGEAQATAALVAALAVMDERRLYLGEGYSSLFVFATQALHLSEHAAYRRIDAARTARRFPILLDRLAASEITLTALGLIAPHLTEANHVALLDAVRHQSKHAVEQLVARLNPQPDVPAVVRKLPSRRPAVQVAASMLAGDPAARSTAPASASCRASWPSAPVLAEDPRLASAEHEPASFTTTVLASAPPTIAPGEAPTAGGGRRRGSDGSRDGGRAAAAECGWQRWGRDVGLPVYGIRYRYTPAIQQPQ